MAPPPKMNEGVSVGVEGRETKTVTFDENHQVEETPLMFSRSSSPESMSSFDTQSMHSSMISEYSRRASEVVSPSEIPDSPSDSMSSSPKRTHSPPTSHHHLRLKEFTSHPKHPHPHHPPPPPSPPHVIFRPSTTSNKTFPTTSELISQRNNDPFSRQRVFYPNTNSRLLETKPPPPPSPLIPPSPLTPRSPLTPPPNPKPSSQTMDTLKQEDKDSSMSEVSEGEEDILAQCISSAMPTPNSSSRKIRKSSSDNALKKKSGIPTNIGGGVGGDSPNSSKSKLPLGKNSSGTTTSSTTPPSGQYSGQIPSSNSKPLRRLTQSSSTSSPSSSAQKCSKVTGNTTTTMDAPTDLDLDFGSGQHTVRAYATEGTPLNFSNSTSLSDLSVLTTATNDNNKTSKPKELHHNTTTAATNKAVSNASVNTEHKSTATALSDSDDAASDNSSVYEESDDLLISYLIQTGMSINRYRENDSTVSRKSTTGGVRGVLSHTNHSTNIAGSSIVANSLSHSGIGSKTYINVNTAAANTGYSGVVGPKHHHQQQQSSNGDWNPTAFTPGVSNLSMVPPFRVRDFTMDMDTVKSYTVEGTPRNFSTATSLSDLTIDSMEGGGSLRGGGGGGSRKGGGGGGSSDGGNTNGQGGLGGNRNLNNSKRGEGSERRRGGEGRGNTSSYGNAGGVGGSTHNQYPVTFLPPSNDTLHTYHMEGTPNSVSRRDSLSSLGLTSNDGMGDNKGKNKSSYNAGGVQVGAQGSDPEIDNSHSIPKERHVIGQSSEGSCIAGDNGSDRPIRFAVEDTPATFSRRSSLSSLASGVEDIKLDNTYGNNRHYISNISGNNNGIKSKNINNSSTGAKGESKVVAGANGQQQTVTLDNGDSEEEEEQLLLEQCIYAALPKSRLPLGEESARRHFRAKHYIQRNSPAFKKNPHPSPNSSSAASSTTSPSKKDGANGNSNSTSTTPGMPGLFLPSRPGNYNNTNNAGGVSSLLAKSKSASLEIPQYIMDNDEADTDSLYRHLFPNHAMNTGSDHNLNGSQSSIDDEDNDNDNRPLTKAHHRYTARLMTRSCSDMTALDSDDHDYPATSRPSRYGAWTRGQGQGHLSQEDIHTVGSAMKTETAGCSDGQAHHALSQ